MNLKRRGRAQIWAILLAGCLVALLASTTGAAPLPHAPSDAPWGADVRVDDDPGAAVQESPAIAVDPNGNAYAVWEDYRNGYEDIYFSYRPAGGNWETNVMVNDGSSPGLADQGRASIAVDPWGNAFAVWAGQKFIVPWPPFVYYTLNSDYRPAGGNWGTDVTLSDVSQGRPDIAVDPNGNAYAVYTACEDQPPQTCDWNIHFSYRRSQVSMQLGDLVWYDTDRDGLRDPGEPGAEGIDATLYPNGTCTAPSITMMDTTDANGNYLFTAPPGCTYCLEFSNIPAGWGITLQDRGSDEAVDSDADPATGHIESIVLVADDLHEDVGLRVGEEFVPELGTLALLGSGLGAVAGYAALIWRKK